MVENDFLDLTNDLRKHEVTFRLVPKQLQAFPCAVQLKWRSVRFAPKNTDAVPDGKGVYAFIVAENDVGLPPHGYVMYIGKAGDGKHTLRKRFGDYFQDKKGPKRPRIYRLLNHWGDVLHFCFAEIKDTAVELTDIEIALNDALLPPFCKKDFSAALRTAINAF